MHSYIFGLFISPFITCLKLVDNVVLVLWKVFTSRWVRSAIYAQSTESARLYIHGFTRFSSPISRLHARLYTFCTGLITITTYKLLGGIE